MLTVSHEQAYKLQACPKYSQILRFRKGGQMFIDCSLLEDFYKNGYRPINGDWWLGMEIAGKLNDLNLTDKDMFVEVRVAS